MRILNRAVFLVLAVLLILVSTASFAQVERATITGTLTDKNGTTYQLMGDTSKLSEHVGHEVKITGTAAASSSGAASESGAAHAGAASQTLQVSSVKHIAKSCQTGKSGMSH